MPDGTENSRGSVEDIRRSLHERASEMWGEARAASIETTIDEVAHRIHTLARDLPDAGEEPGFYF